MEAVMTVINNLSKKLKLTQKLNDIKKLNFETLSLADIARTNKAIAEINENLNLFDNESHESIIRDINKITKKLISRKKEIVKSMEIQKCYYNDIQ